MAQYFPEEIVREILLKLPVQSLSRFNCVNKEWCSIIKSPTFASDHLAHTNRSENNSTSRRLLALKVSDETNHPYKNTTTIITACLSKQETEQTLDNVVKSFDEYTDLSFLHKSSIPFSFEVVGSCNGLVLLRCFNTLILWNPLVEKFVTISEPHTDLSYYDVGWGFGFDSRTNDCRVVKIDSQVQVFSLATGSWKSSKVGAPPACSLSNCGPQRFINGAIHWLASTRIVGNDDDKRHSILSFDISNETFREIMLPKGLSILNNCFRSPIFYSITEYGKSLALCVGKTRFISLWVMKEYGAAESWTQVLAHTTLEDIPKPLGFSSSGELLWKTESGKLASYDPKSTKIETENAAKGDYCFAGSYVESLVLLNQPNLSRKRPIRGE
ncbi:F-box/kelch-repeat protein At3g23880-like [Corylus avellana]|uniref:F-box/kelch-repeat protein At3g23880-like n=1 Tax=Corylus avellana TaxID=13451 RepID=UPI00286D041C|nr:F-box/kelch-repeat protein At3g23880-like [Corylus avellana]